MPLFRVRIDSDRSEPPNQQVFKAGTRDRHDSIDLLNRGNMDSFRLLIQLKKQEKELAEKIKSVQKMAIEDAMSFGKTGQLDTIDGAKVVFKLVAVKPKPTNEIQIMMEHLEFVRENLQKSNSSRIAELKAELEALTTNPEIQEIESEIDAAMGAIASEKVGQIAITLPK
jgi:hypothetical protein